MLKLFVISIRVAMPLMLTIAILLAARAYAPMERRTVTRVTTIVGVSGIGVGALIAWLRLNSTWIDIPTFTAWVGAPTYVAMALFLVAMWLFGGRDLRDVNQTWRHRFVTVTAMLALAFVSVFFAFAYFFATDGIVLMGSSLFETESMLRLAGFILGSLLVLVVSWGYVKSAARVPWWVRTLITTVVFIAVAGPRLILLYQQFATRKFVPQSTLIFDMVLWIQRNTSTTNLALAVLMACPGLLALWLIPRRIDGSKPTQRIHLAERISRRRFLALSVVGSATFCWALTEGQRRAEYVPELSALEPIEVRDGSVYVSRDLVSDGHLHRFGYQTSNGVEVRFIVIKKNATAFGVGLDACEICGDSGYYEDRGKVICRKCNVMMNIQTIGFPGGCNPIPIEYEVEATQLRFPVEVLESHESVFA